MGRLPAERGARHRVRRPRVEVARTGLDPEKIGRQYHRAETPRQLSGRRARVEVRGRGAIDYLRAVRPPIRARTAAPVSGAGGSEQPVRPGKRFSRGLGRDRAPGPAAGDATARPWPRPRPSSTPDGSPTRSTGSSPRTEPSATRPIEIRTLRLRDDAARRSSPGPGARPGRRCTPTRFPTSSARSPRSTSTRLTGDDPRGRRRPPRCAHRAQPPGPPTTRSASSTASTAPRPTAHGRDRDTAPGAEGAAWYDPYPQRYGPQTRAMVEKRGNVWMADSPANAALVLDLLVARGVIGAVAAHLGERPCFSLQKSTLRHLRARTRVRRMAPGRRVPRRRRPHDERLGGAHAVRRRSPDPGTRARPAPLRRDPLDRGRDGRALGRSGPDRAARGRHAAGASRVRRRRRADVRRAASCTARTCPRT